MKREYGNLDRIFVGCFDAVVVDGGWRPRRIPECLRSLYEEAESSRIRMQCTSGVRLRFVSDTRRLSIALRYGVEARTNYRGELVVDGEEQGGFGPTERSDKWAGVVFEQANDARRTFDLWLPHMCQADVLSVEVDAGSGVEPASKLSLRWLAYGDSITQGMTATLPTRTYVGRCALALEAEVKNLGIGGAILDPRLADGVPDGAYDLITIAYGTNDFSQGVTGEQLRERTRRLVTALRSKHPRAAIVLLTTLTWVRENKPNANGVTLDQFRQSIVGLEKEFARVHLVQGQTMIPEDDRWFVDKVHPNDEGFELYAKNLLPHLRLAIGTGR